MPADARYLLGMSYPSSECQHAQQTVYEPLANPFAKLSPSLAEAAAHSIPILVASAPFVATFTTVFCGCIIF